MTRTSHIRLGLVCIATLLVVLGTLQTGHSQPPTGIGGGIRGGPPVFPGPPTGPAMPGPGGIRGGITGISGRPPGFPEIPGPPEFPRPPVGPIGPGFGRRPGIGGLPGGPAIYEWTCSNCGRHLGTGPTAPLVRICPGCGARLEGSEIVDGPRPPGIAGPGMPIMPPGSGPPAFGNPGFGVPAPPAFDNGIYVPPANPTPAESNRGNMIRVVAITIGILLFLLIGIAAIVFVVLKQQPVKRSRPRRRPRYDEDEDY
jgi:hypothetical protein